MAEWLTFKQAKVLGLKTYNAEKPCPRCGSHVRRAWEVSGSCEPCKRHRTREWAARNPDAAQRWKQRNPERQRAIAREHRWRKLGLPTPTRPRSELCELCGGPPNGNGALHLDHCHATGAFRGWLCSECNTGIGKLGDNVDGLKRALAYLERSSLLT